MRAVVFKHLQNGITLIEVLVTLIVVSLGLLGQAALMAQSSKTGNTALMRSQATLLANDMFERMRVNHNQAVLGNYKTNYGVSAPTDSSIASQELLSWKSNVSQMLPNGDAVINVDGTGLANITLRWASNGATGTTTTPITFTTVSRI